MTIVEFLNINLQCYCYWSREKGLEKSWAQKFNSVQGATFKIKAPIETSFALIACLWGHQNYSKGHCPNPLEYIQAQSLLPQPNLASVEVMM